MKNRDQEVCESCGKSFSYEDVQPSVLDLQPETVRTLLPWGASAMARHSEERFRKALEQLAEALSA